MTARWVVEEVRPNRNLNITWQPISLLVKNEPPAGSDYEAAAAFTHGLLRVMESVRKADGDDAVEKVYWDFASRIHHDKDRDFDIAAALINIGVDGSHAVAAVEETFEDEVRTRMAAGLALTGDDVGTPIIALDDDNGERVALFGPVITKVPSAEQSLKLWDGFVACAQTPGFWEVKRTRTQGPEFGERP